MYVTEDLIVQCLEEYIEVARMETKEHIAMCQCHHCGHESPMKFPVVVRKSDIEAFRTVIRVAEKYLGEKGVTQMLLYDMFYEIIDNIRKKREEERNKKPHLVLLSGGRASVIQDVTSDQGLP